MDSGRTGAERLRVLIVDEGHAGHSAQSRGFVHAARVGAPDLEVDTLRARLRTPGVLRTALLRLVSSLPLGLPESVLCACYDMPSWPASTRSRPDLIVSSGGQGAILAASLARRYGVRWIFCGDASGIPRSCLDIVISPLERVGDPLWLRAEVLFCDPLPTPSGLDRSPGENWAAVLIGGPSRSHRYVRQDWLGLVEGLHRLAEGGWRFLLTTSARTPADVEDFLRNRLAPRLLTRAVWWHRAPERLARQFLTDADLALVTQDSLTMTSEAVTSGKPVVALMPACYRPSPVLESVLAEQSRRGRLLRCRMDQMPDAPALAQQHFLAIDPGLLPTLAHRALALSGALPSWEEPCS